jgi:hypothetical protein
VPSRPFYHGLRNARQRGITAPQVALRDRCRRQVQTRSWVTNQTAGPTCHLCTRSEPGVSSGRRVSQWVAAHEELTLLARRRSELDGLEGPALLRALRAGVHRHLGLGSFGEYVERLFGSRRRTLEDKLRTAEALEQLPELTRTLREGTVSWSAVRELARVATPETEREWLDAAKGRTVHEVERLVSARKRCARPTNEADVSERRHALRFEVSAETFAIFREAMRALRQKSNAQLDDDSALLLMAREVLGGRGGWGWLWRHEFGSLRRCFETSLSRASRAGVWRKGSAASTRAGSEQR